MGVTKNACKAKEAAQLCGVEGQGLWKGLGKGSGDWRKPHGSMS